MEIMEIHINTQDNTGIKIDNIRFQKMLFVYNALEEGWTIKKKNDSFIFSKNHEGKKEIFLESYLANFMKANLDINKILE